MNFQQLLESEITFIAVMGGVLFVLAGVVVYFFPPKEINGLYGYRTANSMKSQERWTFAQIYSARKMMWYGSALILVGIAASFIKTSEGIGTIIGLALLISCPIALYLKVEKKLSKRFQEV